MSLPTGVIKLELETGPVVANGAKVEDTLNRIRSSAQETGKETEFSSKRAAQSLAGLATSTAATAFAYKNLGDMQLDVARAHRKLEEAQQRLTKAQHDTKASAQDVRDAMRDVAIAGENYGQVTDRVREAQVMFTLSLGTMAVTAIPQAISGIKSLHGAFIALEATTQKYVLIALAAVAAFEGIAHVIKALNPNIDITIEGMGNKLYNSIFKANTITSDYTGTLENFNTVTKKTHTEIVKENQVITDMTGIWKQQNEQVKKSIDLHSQYNGIMEKQSDILKKNDKSLTEYNTKVDDSIKSTQDLVDWSVFVFRAASGMIPDTVPNAFAKYQPVIKEGLFGIKRTGAKLDFGSYWNAKLAKALGRSTSTADTISYPGLGSFATSASAIKEAERQSRETLLNELNITKRFTQQQLDFASLFRLKQQLFEQQVLSLEAITGLDYDMIKNRILRQELERGATVEEAVRRAENVAKNALQDRADELKRLHILGLGTNHSLGGGMLGGVMFGRGETGQTLARMFGVNSLSEISHDQSLTFAGLGLGTLTKIKSGQLSIVGTRIKATGSVSTFNGVGLTTAKGRSSKHRGGGRTQGDPGGIQFAAAMLNEILPPNSLDSEALSQVYGYSNAIAAKGWLSTEVGQERLRHMISQAAGESKQRALVAKYGKQAAGFSAILGISTDEAISVLSNPATSGDLGGMALYKQLATLG